jgi:hypothetical protein
LTAFNTPTQCVDNSTTISTHWHFNTQRNESTNTSTQCHHSNNHLNTSPYCQHINNQSRATPTLQHSQRSNTQQHGSHVQVTCKTRTRLLASRKIQWCDPAFYGYLCWMLERKRLTLDLSPKAWPRDSFAKHTHTRTNANRISSIFILGNLGNVQKVIWRTSAVFTCNATRACGARDSKRPHCEFVFITKIVTSPSECHAYLLGCKHRRCSPPKFELSLNVVSTPAYLADTAFQLNFVRLPQGFHNHCLVSWNGFRIGSTKVLSAAYLYGSRNKAGADSFRELMNE